MTFITFCLGCKQVIVQLDHTGEYVEATCLMDLEVKNGQKVLVYCDTVNDLYYLYSQIGASMRATQTQLGTIRSRRPILKINK